MTGFPAQILKDVQDEWLASGGVCKISKKQEKLILNAFLSVFNMLLFPEIPVAIASIMKLAISMAAKDIKTDGNVIETFLINLKAMVKKLDMEEQINAELQSFTKKYGFVPLIDIWEKL